LASILLSVSGAIAVVALLIAGLRLVRGPDAPTRAVSVDAMTVIAIPLMLLAAHHAGRGIYIDVALVFALLSFIAVLSLARYLEGGI